MPNLTHEGLRIVTDVATRHEVSLDVALTLLGALAQGNGRQAQFNHPELGGNQWSQGGMIMRYACFPGRRRLAIQQGGRVRVYDTGEHTISGFSQQQGGDQSLTFTSQFGLVRVADLALFSPQSDRSQNRSSPASATPSQMPGAAPPPTVVGAAPAPPASLATEDIVKTIERLAELRQKNILTEEEFAVKKAELLSRP
jgi:hypothetical protein